jgi:hypothetical protein
MTKFGRLYERGMGATTKRYLSYILTPLFVVIIYAFFLSSDLLTFVVFFVLMLTMIYYRLNAKIPIVYAIVLFLFAGIALSYTQNPTFANVFAIYAFWLIVIGVICLIIQYHREGRSGWPTLN